MRGARFHGFQFDALTIYARRVGRKVKIAPGFLSDVKARFLAVVVATARFPIRYADIASHAHEEDEIFAKDQETHYSFNAISNVPLGMPILCISYRSDISFLYMRYTCFEIHSKMFGADFPAHVYLNIALLRIDNSVKG